MATKPLDLGDAFRGRSREPVHQIPPRQPRIVDAALEDDLGDHEEL